MGQGLVNPMEAVKKPKSLVGGVVGEAIKEKDKPKPVKTDEAMNKEATNN